MWQHLGGRKSSKKRLGLGQSRAFYRMVLGTVPVFAVAFFVTFLASSIFTPINSSNAAETTITASITYNPYSLTLSAEDAAISLPLNVQSNGVMTVASSDLSISTSSPSGYKLYLGMTGTNAYTNSLVHSTDASSVITSSGTLDAPVVLANGTWGFAIPKNTTSVVSNNFSTSYDDTRTSGVPSETEKFAAVPNSLSEPEKIAQSNSANTTPNVIPIYYGVRVGYETPVGSYVNKVLYTAMADAGPNSNLYVSPDTTSVAGGGTLRITTTLVSSNSNIDYEVYVLTASQHANVTAAQNPTDIRTLTSSRIPASDCSRVANVDMLQLDCTSPAVAEPGQYWIHVFIPDYDLQYAKQVTYIVPTMQDDESIAACLAAETGTSFTLRDSRDDNEYVVTKLADGNCWMTENLRLGSTTADLTLTPSDSNITSGSFTIPTTAVQTSGSTEWSDASNSSNAKHVYATGNDTYGNYYNWYTATAGTGLGTMKSTSATVLTNAASSICPKGWRLPDGGASTTKSFAELDKALGGTGANRTDTTQRDKFISSPYNFPYSGRYNFGGGVFDQDSSGVWWSRSAFTTASQAYYFRLRTSGGVSPQLYNNVGSGCAVRCVAE